MAEGAQVLEVTVAADGTLVVGSETLASFGARPGDHLRLVKSDVLRAPRSMLGVLSRDIGFTQEHLDEIRVEMGSGLGDDISR